MRTMDCSMQRVWKFKHDSDMRWHTSRVKKYLNTGRKWEATA